MEEKKESNFLCVAITGNFGSGKSTVAGIIADAGYKVISTDLLAQEIMKTDTRVKNNIISAFGSDSYQADGNPNKQFLAENVFGNSEANISNLTKLNQIVHPAVIEEMMNRVEYYESTGEQIVFVESALVFEAGLDEGFDYIIAVLAPEEQILKRASLRGILPEDAANRMKSQMSAQEKVKLSDFVIENKSDMNALIESTNFILTLLKSMVG